ncbi:MAG: hypothetical protein IKV99_07520 [Oscillospiraceae bacterium]|nr:hypothetical protein [Oscillospiraceae bacterium]
MKKYISVVLCVAMIVALLSVFVTAATIDSVEFTLTPPTVGNPLETTNFNSNEIISLGFLDYEKLEGLKGKTTFVDVTTFIEQNKISIDEAENGKRYIAVFSVFLTEGDRFSNAPQLKETSDLACECLAVDSSCLYAYVVFTPTASLPSSKSHDVTVDYVEGEKATPIYSVDITWGSMEFTYTAASEGTWNPATHQFDNAVPRQWSHANDANKITVTNHSNAPITAEFAFTPHSSFSNLLSSFEGDSQTALTDNKLTLHSAVDSAANAAPFAAAYLELSGDINSPLTEKTTCGTVTVTIK